VNNPLASSLHSSKRALLLGLAAAGLSIGSARSQNNATRIRVPTTATGQLAIGRVRGRLQLAYDEQGLRFGAPLYLRVIKSQRRLEVWVKGKTNAYVRLRGYRLCGSSSKAGPRRNRQNDRQPEGFYQIERTALRPQHAGYLGLDIGWPNSFDLGQNWSGTTSLFQAGCAGDPNFGLTDPDMEEVYALVHGALAGGQSAVPVHIFPFEMTGLRMLTVGEGASGAFWRQLAPAWQSFERTKKPPLVRVQGRRYVVVGS
jgi:murein L,D-transpeptidase YafK